MSDSRTGWSWDGDDGAQAAPSSAHGPGAQRDGADPAGSTGYGGYGDGGQASSGGSSPWEVPGPAGATTGGSGEQGYGAAAPGAQGQWGAGAQGQWGTGAQGQATPGQWGAPAPGTPPQGYGQYGMPAGPMGYGGAPRPGIIPLRPLSIGEIYEGAIQSIRTNPAVMFGATLVIYAVLAVVSAVLTWLMFSSFPMDSTWLGTDPLAGMNVAGAASGFAGLNFVVPLLTFLATTLLTGVLICSVSQAVIGRKVSFAQVWELVKPRFWRLLAQSLLMSLLSVVYVFTVIMVMVLPLAGILAASEGSGTGAGIGLALFIVLFLATLPLTLYLYGRLAFAPAAVALETDRLTGRPMGAVASFGRSWRLTKGVGWRVAGILFLTGIIVAAVSFALALPASLITGLMAGASPVASLVTNSFLSTLINAVAVPFFSAAVALLYIDLRMRKEGLDVELARAAGVS